MSHRPRTSGFVLQLFLTVITLVAAGTNRSFGDVFTYTKGPKEKELNGVKQGTIIGEGTWSKPAGSDMGAVSAVATRVGGGFVYQGGVSVTPNVKPGPVVGPPQMDLDNGKFSFEIVNTFYGANPEMANGTYDVWLIYKYKAGANVPEVDMVEKFTTVVVERPLWQVTRGSVSVDRIVPRPERVTLDGSYTIGEGWFRSTPVRVWFLPAGGGEVKMLDATTAGGTWTVSATVLAGNYKFLATMAIDNLAPGSGSNQHLSSGLMPSVNVPPDR